MDNEEISVEPTILEQHPSLESQESPDATLDLIDSLDCVDNLDGNTESETNDYPKKNWSYIAILGFALFTIIVMTIAILIVCFTTPKPSKSCQLNFKTAINSNSFQHNSYPYSLATGDFNHDHFLDIVVANSGTNNIGIFLNYGNGTFASQITFTTGGSTRPVSVAVGDFNNDTHVDIAVANYDTHNIEIFRGYGNGSFTSQTTFSTGVSCPVSIAVSDLNNDHWLDIVVANNGTNSIGIFFGYENGSFVNHITYLTGYDSLPYSVVVGDFNNDHYVDIAVANYGTDNVGVFLGYGNGSFTTQTTYSTRSQSSPYSIAVNDFNNDGQQDIAVANSGTDNVGIFLGCRNGTLLSYTTHSISPGASPRSIIIGDFNQDNIVDIAVSNYDTSNISILIGYGNGSFATPTMYSTGIDSGPLGMAAGDFDNNNQSNIAVVNSVTNNIFVLIGYSILHSPNPVTYSTGDDSFPNQISSGDFNNDTQIDLAVANYGTSTVSIFLGYGNGSFQQQSIYSTGNNSHPYALTVADLDEDYRLDIIIANANTDSVGVLYGYGNGTFTPVFKYFSGYLSSLNWVTVADINNDHHPDIVFANYGSNTIGVFLGYGNRTFENVMTYSTGDGSRPYSVGTGDFNKDGRLDIAVPYFGSNSLCIFLGFGNGTFALFTMYSTGNNSLPWSITIADLNKDNNLDVIVTNSAANNIGIFFGFGNGSFDTQLTYAADPQSNPLWQSVADMNNDGWLDIVIANTNMNNVGILLGDKHGYFDSETTYPTGSGTIPCSIVIGDFNNDNRLDIATTNSGTNNIAILLGHPTEQAANLSATNVPILLGDYYADFVSKITYSTGSSSQPYSVAVGDLNDDTEMDLVVANSGNANLGLLLGYGNGTFANETTYSVGVGSSPRYVLIDDFNNDNQSDVAVTDPEYNRIIVLLGTGNATFSIEMTYSTGVESQPSTLAIGDFNSDNYIDLAVTNAGTDTIGIFFGFDYTSFAKQNPCDSEQNSQPTAVAIGDFNNDGYLDFVSSLYGTSNAGVFLGYGNGSFTPMITYSNVPSSHPYWVAVGDFNNDKQLDITVANWGVDSIAVIFGFGNGTFTEPISYSTGVDSRPVSVAVGDFNNDHYLDIAAANYGGNSIGVFLGYGNGSFRNVTIFSAGQDSAPCSVAVYDVNNDNQSDIIVANEGTSNVGVFLGNGDGNFAEQVTFSTGLASTPWNTVAGDFNKDGHLDLVSANYGTGTIGILYGYGNGTFGNLCTYATGVGSNPSNVHIGDFNNDHQLDIIVSDTTSTNVGVFFGYSDGTFASISTVPMGPGSSAYFVAVGDFNNDSRLDFTIADYGNNNIGVLLANGTKPFGGQTMFSAGEGSRPSSVAVGYFNNDSQLDIAIANYGTDNIGILLGYGNRLFSNVTMYSTGNGSRPLSLAVGDFNNDSLTDIVVANSETNNVIVLLGDGHGNFSILLTYSMGENSQPVSLAVGYFNRDYLLDIAVANFGTNNVCILFGCGNGSFTNQTWYPLDYNSRPNSIIFKDLNKDGREDIVVATYGTNNIKILLNLC